jgi:hypothetical protein
MSDISFCQLSRPEEQQRGFKGQDKSGILLLKRALASVAGLDMGPIDIGGR